MRLLQKFSFVLLLLAIGLPAAAQNSTGVFTLAHDTRWNDTLIPAGQYSLSLEEAHMIALLKPVDHRKAGVFVIPASHEYATPCRSSAVRIDRTSSGWTTTSVCLAESGMTLFFRSPSGNAVVASAATATKMAAAGGSR